MTYRTLDLPSILRLTELADYFVAFALRAVCELGVADHLTSGPRSAEALAAACGAHPASLRRVIRTLVSKNVFEEVEPERYGLAPMGELLRTSHPFSMRGAFPLIRADVEAWAQFAHTLRTGESAFEVRHGESYYAYLARHPETAARVDRAVAAANPFVVREVARMEVWTAVHTVVDVGGGTGSFLAGLLERRPELHGVLFDVAGVISRSSEYLAPVADRCSAVAGDFFEAVPAGFDTYMLKTILHDWDDVRAGRILSAIRRVMPATGRLLVIEAVLPLLDAFDFGKLMDVNSLALTAGPDRDRSELERLLESHGFTVTRVLPTSHALTLFEALPA